MFARVLELRDVTLNIGRDAETRALLHEVSIQFPAGHFAAIVGPSGCGKSTLLKVIAGLLEPTGGTVHWEGRDLAEEEDLHPSEIGYVPQFSIAYDHLDVWESVETALKLRVAGLDADEREEKVEQILKAVGLDEIADRRVKVLSGGQKRRLALALEMVTSPALMIADEVTSGLDPKAEQEVVELMHRIAHEERRIVLTVTHSLRHLALYDSVVVLQQGHVAYHGPGRHLLHYFDVENPEEVYPRLTRRSPNGWHTSWQKHRLSYYETDNMPLAGAAPVNFAERDSRSKIPPREKDPEPERPPEEKKGPPPSLRSLLAGSEEAARKVGDSRDAEVTKSSEEAIEDTSPLPGFASQFVTLLGRRFRIFVRDRPQLLLQLALIVGFPILVVIFALDGLPAVQSLNLAMSSDPVALAKESVEYMQQASKTGSLVSGLIMFQVILLTLMGANNAAREIAGERPIFEKEKLGGVRASAYLASKVAYLFFLVLIQSTWMALFVKLVCRFPGPIVPQIVLLVLVNAAMTLVCLGISSLSRSAEQASLISIYLVGFQLPLSGAVLAPPELIGAITRPFIAAYWGWSGLVQTMKDTRFYEVVVQVSQTGLSHSMLCLWVLATHVIVGILLAYTGCRRSQWE